jgi:hypothetical protein
MFLLFIFFLLCSAAVLYFAGVLMNTLNAKAHLKLTLTSIPTKYKTATLVITLNYGAIADVHTLPITTAHDKFFQPFTSRFPATDLNNGDSSTAPTGLAAISHQPPSLRFTDCPKTHPHN